MANLLAQKLTFEFVQLQPPNRLLAHYLWAVLIARIYEDSLCCAGYAVGRCA